jgi:Alr-MurF fusion protein
MIKEYSIPDIAAACGGELHLQYENATVRHLVTDSRKFSFPRDSLFIAIEGERHDGHNYIAGMYRQEVRNFLVSRLPAEMSEFKGSNFILVPDTLLALQRIAAMHRSFFKIPVIGITGSNGKTILKEWLYQLMQNDRIVVRSPKSYNSQVGVPLSVWQLRQHHELAIFEAGISRPGEMERLEPVIKPDIGVITNIGEAHQENFTDRKHKLRQKLLLFNNSGVLVYCRDHKLIDEYVRTRLPYSAMRLFSWSVSRNADLIIKKIESNRGNTIISAFYKDAPCSFTIPFTDRASIENAIHACAVLLLLGYPAEYLASHAPGLNPVAMRMELKRGINNCTIINDSYNSDPGSLAIAIDFLSRQSQHRKRSIILSDMFQTGRSMEELYMETGEMISREKIDRVVGIGENISCIKKYYSGPADFYASTPEYIAAFDPAVFQDEAVLLKGSRKFGFERISALLEEKAHATVMEINLDNLVRNYNYFKSLLNEKTRIMAVVKAFSYGSGSYEIANILAHNLVDYLAVAFTDEGVGLRKAGIKVPIMVMNPEPGNFARMTAHDLEPEIFNFSGLKLLIEKLQQKRLMKYPVHIKLDTGMYRLGFSDHELAGLIGLIKNCESVYVKSVFSHLAASDDPMHDDFTHEQIGLFKNMSDKLCRELGYPFLRHILNSAGIERFPGAQFDMVRPGIGLYGVSALKNNRLANVNTFRSVISQIKLVPGGRTIGYSRGHKAGTDTRIAIVPVGYADGLDRRLGNGIGRMTVAGVAVPVIGNVCMDMCMLDLGDLAAREGDEVIVFGDENPVSEMAATLSTIPYEVFTRISERVKRVYIQE